MSARKKGIQKLLSILFNRYVNNQSSEKEKDLVDKIYDSLGKKEEIDRNHLDQINKELKASIDKRLFHSTKRSIVFSWKYAAAACLLISLGISIYFVQFGNFNSHGSHPVNASRPNTEPTPTLSINEQQLYVINEQIPKGSTFKMIEQDRVLDLSDLPEESSIRKISVENPSKTPISLLLMDGSQVWLNYKSKLDFDFDEQANMRVAHAEGEVFLHVKKFKNKDGNIPFIVKTNLQTIEVLGTQFNINASLADEENVELLEGSIRLMHNKSSKKVLLTPGQKAFLNNQQSQILVLKSNSEEKAKAWRRGLFYFENESMKMVGKELSNWYEKSIIIDPELNELSITGMIKRYDDIHQVLELMELTNNIKFKSMNDKIYISRRN